jgi:hypothetical protein
MLHTPAEFLATMRKDTSTRAMCAIAETRPNVRMRVDSIKFKVPKCPAKDDVLGWIKWSGADTCSPAQEKKLKAEKGGRLSAPKR